jgi:hypothetical protein
MERMIVTPQTSITEATSPSRRRKNQIVSVRCGRARGLTRFIRPSHSPRLTATPEHLFDYLTCEFIGRDLSPGGC